MWIEPLEYIDAGDRLVVPYRFGGQGHHTGIEVEFSFVHVFTMRNRKVARVDVYKTKTQALEAVGRSEQPNEKRPWHGAFREYRHGDSNSGFRRERAAS